MCLGEHPNEFIIRHDCLILLRRIGNTLSFSLVFICTLIHESKLLGQSNVSSESAQLLIGPYSCKYLPWHECFLFTFLCFLAHADGFE